MSLRKLAPSRNVVFNQTGMDFVTEISVVQVVDDKKLVFRGCKSPRVIIKGINHGVYTASNALS